MPCCDTWQVAKQREAEIINDMLAAAREAQGAGNGGGAASAPDTAAPAGPSTPGAAAAAAAGRIGQPAQPRLRPPTSSPAIAKWLAQPPAGFGTQKPMPGREQEFNEYVPRDPTRSPWNPALFQNQHRLTPRYDDTWHDDTWHDDTWQACSLWDAGVHMVALNFQTPSRAMLLNQALFALNGNCGYVLRPEHRPQAPTGPEPEEPQQVAEADRNTDQPEVGLHILIA